MSAEHQGIEVNKFFRALVKLEGSDLHMKVGKPPCVRVRNELRPLNHPAIERREMAEYLVPMMNDRNRRIFDEEGGADFSHTLRRGWRRLAVPRQPAAAERLHGAGRPPHQQQDSRL